MYSNLDAKSNRPPGFDTACGWLLFHVRQSPHWRLVYTFVSMFARAVHALTVVHSAGEVTMGALGDSFYEYLLKVWVYRGGRNGVDAPGRSIFDNTIKVGC